jgi:type IX secretion system PorP/SprF family membrane protein
LVYFLRIKSKGYLDFHQIESIVKTFLFFFPCILLAALLCCPLHLRAQDIHFSQFGNSPVNLNPGLAGVFGGDMRFAAVYRDQHRSIPVPYQTVGGSWESKIYLNKGAYNRFLTAGLLFNYDRQGSIHLTSMHLGIPVSLTLPVAKTQFITLGVTPNFGQRAFNTNSLSFDAQWNDCVFDPSAPFREDQLFQNNSLRYFDLNAGLNYRLQSAGRRSKLDLGGSLFHINRPRHDFWTAGVNEEGQVRLRHRWSFYALGALQLTDNTDLIANGLYRWQGTYKEIVYGGGLRLHLDRRPYRELAVQVGVNYRQRYGDALIPQAEIHYRTWTLGFTYDVNMFSDIDLLTDRRAGPEVSLIYRLYKLKAAPFKSCPII